MVYHGIYGTKSPRYSVSSPDAAFRRQADIWLQYGFRTGQQRINLLDAVSDGQLDAPVVLVFGHYRVMNWADKAYNDWGREIDHALGAKGYYCDSFPSTEIPLGTFCIDADGYVRVGRQRYAALVLHNVSDSDREAWRKIADGKKLATRVFDASSAEEVAAYLDSVKAVKQTPFSPYGLTCNWWDSNRLPYPDGTITLNDGTVVRMRGCGPNVEGNTIVGTLVTPRGKASFDALGLCAVRFDEHGKLEAAAGCIKRLAAGDFRFEYKDGIDVALLKINGVWNGILVVNDVSEPVPPRLLAITDRWIRLRGWRGL